MLKQIALLLVVLCLILSVMLCACVKQQNPAGPATNPPQGNTPGTSTDVPPATTTTPIPSSTAENPPPTTAIPVPSTTMQMDPPEELEPYNTLFGDFKSWYNKALTCEYSSREFLSMRDLFYCGFEGEGVPTDAEWDALKDKPGFNEDYDFFRLPKDKMNAVLTEYFGITLDYIDSTGFEGLEYLESTDCYYLMHTDANGAEEFEAISTETLDDGSIQVFYRASSHDGMYVVTLMPNPDGGYMILSNQRAE